VIYQALLVVQVDVVDDLAEGFVADFPLEIDYQGLALLQRLLVIFEELGKVRRFVRNYALMCGDLHLRDQNLLFLEPVLIGYEYGWICGLTQTTTIVIVVILLLLLLIAPLCVLLLLCVCL
jgi:hypothetical protein